MAVLENPIVEQETQLSLLQVFPRLPQMADEPEVFESVLQTAESMGANPDRICIMRPASGPKQTWFKHVTPGSFPGRSIDDRIHADGVMVTEPGDALVLPTGDCLVASLQNRLTGSIGLAHCGREASRPPKNGSLPQVIVSLLRLMQPPHKRELVDAYLTNSICPDCFRHDDPDGQELIQDFVQIYGEHSFEGSVEDGKLRMIQITTNLLGGHGVPYGNISINADCPCCNENRGSNRREGRKYRDITILVKKRKRSGV